MAKLAHGFINLIANRAFSRVNSLQHAARRAGAGTARQSALDHSQDKTEGDPDMTTKPILLALLASTAIAAPLSAQELNALVWCDHTDDALI